METDTRLPFIVTMPTSDSHGTISLRERPEGEDNVTLALLHTMLRKAAFDYSQDIRVFVASESVAQQERFITYRIIGNINFFRLIQQLRVGFGAWKVDEYGV